MKSLLLLCSFLFCQSGFTQFVIKTYPLSITDKMTTNIIFPYGIKKADIGSSDVIGRRDERLENVLFLKANRKYGTPTNLSVYTSDGKFYSFFLTYKEFPDTLNLSFTPDSSSIPQVGTTFNEAMMDSNAVLTSREPSFLHRKTVSEKMKAILQGIYIRDQMIWFKFEVFNRSQINFTVDFIHFSVQDKHTAKRTAMQEMDLRPSWQTVLSQVLGNEIKTYLIAFPAFTLARQKKLKIEIQEKNGGRLLTLFIKSKTLLKARVIN